MRPLSRTLLLTAVLAAVCLPARAAAETAAPLPDDTVLRRLVVGTWLSEKNLGIVSGTTYATFAADGTGWRIARAKIVFKPVMWIWIRQRWKIQNGVLSVKSERFASNSADAPAEQETVNCQVQLLDATQFHYRTDDGNRHYARVTALPEEYSKMAEDLSEK